MPFSKRIFLLIALVFTTASCLHSTDQPKTDDARSDTIQFDPSLAQLLGADEYGMRPYVMVILMTGPNDATIKDEQRSELFKGHFANMSRLAEQKKLAVAGPFAKSKTHRGLLVFAVDSVEEAKLLVETDPTVQAGIFTYEMTKLYASAALMRVGHIHQRIQKTKIN